MGFIVAAAVVIALILALSLPPGAMMFSFEEEMEGWTPAGTDLSLGDGEIEWSINRSTDRATHGTYSLKLYLNNLNDAGKIWIERPFATAANREHSVTIEARFATEDFGSMNLFRIIAGAFPEAPRTAENLSPAFRDDTGSGSPEPTGYVWLTKQYTSTVRSGADGRLFVVFGIWGTWEGPRTYYLDEVRVTLAPSLL